MSNENRSNDEIRAGGPRCPKDGATFDEHFDRGFAEGKREADAALLARIAAVEAECANVASDLTNWLVNSPPNAPWKAPVIKARNQLRVAVLAASPTPTGPEWCEQHEQPEVHWVPEPDAPSFSRATRCAGRGPATPTEPTEETP